VDLKQFYYYIAIAEESNLSRAAERLYTSQPSLSRFISKLESSLGVQLFLRKKNNTLVITEAGEHLLDYCRKVVLDYKDFVNYLSENQTNSQQQIIFGVTGEWALQVVALALQEFSVIHPNIRIELLQRPAKELIELLHSGYVDIVYCAYIDKDPTLTYVDIFNTRVDLAVPLEHPLAIKGSEIASDSATTVSINQIKNEVFVLLNNSTILRQNIQQYFDSNNMNPRVGIEVATSLSALSIVECGLAVGLIPRGYGSKKARFLQVDPPIYNTSGIIYRKDTYLTQGKKELIRICKNLDKTTEIPCVWSKGHQNTYL